MLKLIHLIRGVRIVMSVSKKLAYLGPEGSFSHEAASKYHKNGTLVPVETVEKVIDLVVANKAGMGIVPFWNPYELHLRGYQEKLVDSDIIITSHVRLDIGLHLMTKEEIPLNKVRAIFSNVHVFNECSMFFEKNLGDVRRKLTCSTSKAAQEASKRKFSSAICSTLAGKKNRLKIIKQDIQNPDNYTLFFIIEKNGKKIEKICAGISLFAVKLKNEQEKKSLSEAFKTHCLNGLQKWNFPLKREDYHLKFFEIEGRPIDLDLISFYRDLRLKFPEVKLIGNYSESIDQKTTI